MTSWSGLKNAARRPGTDRLSKEAAETIAAGALDYIVGDDERLSRYCESTGLHLGILHETLDQPGFLASVMEYLLADETLILAFSEARGVHPGTVVAAARALGVTPWERGTA